VNATLRLFEMDGEAQENARAYMNLNRVFLCVAARDYT
jgi:hypothetical protein